MIVSYTVNENHPIFLNLPFPVGPRIGRGVTRFSVNSGAGSRSDRGPLDGRDDDFVFATSEGRPVDLRFVESHLRRALTATGVRPRKFCATRHTFISLAVQGADHKWVADYTGTSLEMISKHYVGNVSRDEEQLARITRRPRTRASTKGAG